MDKHTQAKKPLDDDGPDAARPESDEPGRTVTADEDEDVFDEDESFDDDEADDDNDNDIDDEPMPARPVT
jgi:hypothetical protein